MPRVHRTVSLLLASAVAGLLAQPTYADDLLAKAQAAWSRMQSGQATVQSAPVAATGASESWGDTPSAAERTARLPREEVADERRQDERTRDERYDAPRDSGPRARAPISETPKPRSHRTAEDRMYGVREEETSSPSHSRGISCLNVSRVWEGAAALSDRGEEQRAYSAYLALFTSCSDDRELMGTAYQAQKHLSPELLDQLMQEPVLQGPKLAEALLVFKLQKMYAANKAHDYARALEISRDIRSGLLASSDAGALQVSGWLEQRAKNPKAAEQLFRAALRLDRDNDNAREGLAYALLAAGRLDAAQREAERLEGSAGEPVQADVLLARARESLKETHYAEALKSLQAAEHLGLEIDDSVTETRAWILKGLGRTQESAKLFGSLIETHPESKTLQQGLIQSLYVSHDDRELRRIAEESGALGDVAREALAERLDAQGRRAAAAELRGEQAEGTQGEVGATVASRSKSGTEGEGKLLENTIPTLSASIRVADNSTVAVKAERLEMSDGVHKAVGDELRVQFRTEWENLQLTFGGGESRTERSNVVTFEGKAHLYTDGGFLEASVSRAPVDDSLRSYSGINIAVPQGKDTVSERVGRVRDSNVTFSGSTSLDDAKNYHLGYSIGAGSVAGINSYNNGYRRMSLSLTKDFDQPQFSWLSAGPYVSLQSYERDENRFDGAYGGYFSPTSDTDVGMVFNALTREGGSSLYKVSSKIGYASRNLYYGSDSGALLETEAQAAWLLNDWIIVGGGLAVRSSPGYSDVALRVGFSIPLETRTKLYGSDLTLFRSLQ